MPDEVVRGRSVSGSECLVVLAAGAVRGQAFLAAEVSVMSSSTLLPFQPVSMTPARLAAVSFLARYSGRTAYVAGV